MIGVQLGYSAIVSIMPDPTLTPLSPPPIDQSPLKAVLYRVDKAALVDKVNATAHKGWVDWHTKSIPSICPRNFLANVLSGYTLLSPVAESFKHSMDQYFSGPSLFIKYSSLLFSPEKTRQPHFCLH